MHIKVPKKAYYGIGIHVLCIIYIIFVFFISYFSRQSISVTTIRSNYRPWLITPNNIDVDSQDRLYISVYDVIVVYDSDGNYLYTLDFQTPKTFNFYINNEDKIIVTTGSKYYKSDLDGNNVEEYDGTRYIFVDNKKVTSNGNTYKLSNYLGYTKVVKTNETISQVVYRIPIHLYVAKITIFIAQMSFCYVVAIIFINNDSYWTKNRTKSL